MASMERSRGAAVIVCSLQRIQSPTNQVLRVFFSAGLERRLFSAISIRRTISLDRITMPREPIAFRNLVMYEERVHHNRKRRHHVNCFQVRAPMIPEVEAIASNASAPRRPSSPRVLKDPRYVNTMLAGSRHRQCLCTTSTAHDTSSKISVTRT